MLNKIILMGRLTRDPELRRTGSGTAVTSFALAVDRDFKGQGGEKETDFIDVVAWRNTAEFVSKYKEGNNRRSAEVVADNVYFGDSNKDGGNRSGGGSYGGSYDNSYQQPSGDFSEIPDDDAGELPF